MDSLKPLATLMVGRAFTVPGDTRVWELLRLGLCSATVRPARGSGKLNRILDHETGEVVRSFEDRSSLTISLGTLVQEYAP